MSDRIRSQKIGISSYTENELVLDVIGKTNIVGDVNVSGISTLGTVQVSSGIITATTGVVTYYGDGSHLFGVTAFNVVQQDIVNQVVYPTLANSIGVSSVGISTTQLVFNPSTGNLGIGTTNPKVRLQIDGVLGFGTDNNGRTNIKIGDETTGANLTSGYDNIFMGVGAGKGIIGGIAQFNITSSTTLPAQAYYNYNNLTPTGGSGTGGILYLSRNGSGTISNGGFNNYGSNYQVGDVLTVDGSLVGGTSGVDNVTFTVTSLTTNTGYDNIFLGKYAGSNTVSGNRTVSIGHFSGVNFNNGHHNVFIGNYAGCKTTFSTYNTFIGAFSGRDAQSGSFNVFIGQSSGQYSNESFSVFIGNYAGCCATGSQQNIYIGEGSGEFSTNAFRNTGVGKATFNAIDGGSQNTAFGPWAGSSVSGGSYNNFFGAYSGYNTTFGRYNNFFGSYSGVLNTTGTNNNFFGYLSGGSYSVGGNTIGSRNIFFGNYNGFSSSASNKIIIGSGYNYSNYFDSPDTTKDNQLAIGIRTSSAPSKYWLVGNENFNVGIGTTNPTSKLTVGGDIGNTYTTYGSITFSASTLSPVGIHSVLSSSIYRSVEYFIQATEGSRYQAVKLLSIHDGSTSYNTTYGDIFSNGSIATYDVAISGGNVRLVATASTNANVTYIVNYTANKI